MILEKRLKVWVGVIGAIFLAAVTACVKGDGSPDRDGIRLFLGQDGGALLIAIVNGTDDETPVNQLFNRFGPAPEINIRFFSSEGEIKKNESDDYVNVLIPSADQGVTILGARTVLGHMYQISDLGREFNVKNGKCYFAMATYRDRIYKTPLSQRDLVSNTTRVCF